MYINLCFFLDSASRKILRDKKDNHQVTVKEGSAHSPASRRISQVSRWHVSLVGAPRKGRLEDNCRMRNGLRKLINQNIHKKPLESPGPALSELGFLSSGKRVLHSFNDFCPF